MPTLVDLTTQDDDDNVLPFPQSADVLLCTLGFTFPIASDDKRRMTVRESIGGEKVGVLDKPGNFVARPDEREVDIYLLEEQTKSWFKTATVKPETRVRMLTGTYLHETAAGVSRDLSGELDLTWPFAIGFTNDRK